MRVGSLALSRRQALAVAAVLLVLLALVGRELRGAPTARQVPALRASPRVPAVSARRLVVHVVGAVRRPGLYRLREGARFADAVKRAGGATRHADLALVNLAAPLADGVQVLVPRRVPAAAAAGAGDGGASATGASGPVHLNTATLEQLDALPGVGPVTAQKILDYRQEHGAFSSVDDLDAIPGIGPARLEQLRETAAP
ncbi:MAG: ComEA family DNA-binding protein [Actinomycetota bacterium]|nr:ComEA family DNA-binding protein [Actinomycetota bacterium]